VFKVRDIVGLVQPERLPFVSPAAVYPRLGKKKHRDPDPSARQGRGDHQLLPGSARALLQASLVGGEGGVREGGGLMLPRLKTEQEAGLGESAATAAADSSDDDSSPSEDESGPEGQGMRVSGI